MLSRKPIVVVGSINLDLVAVAQRIPRIGETVIGRDFQMHPGGKGANQAVAIARLGYPVCMLGQLGNDAFGTELRKHLQAAGVDISAVGIHEGSSGSAMILVSSSGENCIVVTPGANSRVTPAYIEQHLAVIRGAGIVLSQLEVPIETIEYLASVCRREGIPLLLDPAPASQLPPQVIAATQWFTPNESEAAFYRSKNGSLSVAAAAPEIARELLAAGCRGVVLKMGSAGVYLASPSGGGEMLPAFQVESVDTTAAGDAFNGAFAVGLMSGMSSRDSATFASAVAAISVTRMGAQPSMPTMAEVKLFLSDRALALEKLIPKF